MRLLHGLLLLILPAALGAGCGTMRVSEWKGDELTLCCEGKCDESDWRDKMGSHCSGDFDQTGARTIDRVLGYETKQDSSGATQTKVNSVREHCRIYRC